MHFTPIRIGLIGAAGKLGTAIERLCQNDQSLLVTTRFQRESCLLDGEFELYIDVSLPQGLEARIDAAIKMNRPILIAVTGLSDEQLAYVQESAKKIPIFYAPNFSIGIAIMKKLVEQTSALFYPDATLSITETHHIHKKDTPSGTAKLLATATGKEVDIKSLRSGETVGIHEMVFDCIEEQISITHMAKSRDVFARGALAAARFLSTQRAGLYTMESLMNHELRSSLCNASL